MSAGGRLDAWLSSPLAWDQQGNNRPQVRPVPPPVMPPAPVAAVEPGAAMTPPVRYPVMSQPQGPAPASYTQSSAQVMAPSAGPGFVAPGYVAPAPVSAPFAYGAPYMSAGGMFARPGAPSPFALPFGAALGQGLGMSGLQARGGMGAGLDYFATGFAGLVGTVAGGVVGGALGSLSGNTLSGIDMGTTVGGMAGSFFLADNPYYRATVSALTRGSRERVVGMGEVSTLSQAQILGGSAMSLAGRGLSASGAESLYNQMESAAHRSGGRYSRTDMQNVYAASLSSGLLDSTFDVKQTAETLQSVMRLMALAGQVTGSPDFRENVRLLGQLKAGGFALSEMRSTLLKISDFAGGSGLSVGQAMATGGAWGAGAFGSIGVTSGAGMLQGLGTQSMVRQAIGAGLLSPQQLSLMGGQDNITQRLLQGQAGLVARQDALLPYLTRYGASGLEIDADKVGQIAGGRVSIEQMVRQGAGTMDTRKIQDVNNNIDKLRDDLVKQLGPGGMLRMTLSQMERIRSSTGGVLDMASAGQALGLDPQMSRLVAQMGSSPQFWIGQQDRLAQSLRERQFEDRQQLRDRYRSHGDLYLDRVRRMGAGITAPFESASEDLSEMWGDDLLREEMDAVGYSVQRRGRGVRYLAGNQGTLRAAARAGGSRRMVRGGIYTGNTYSDMFADLDNRWSRNRYGAGRNELEALREAADDWYMPEALEAVYTTAAPMLGGRAFRDYQALGARLTRDSGISRQALSTSVDGKATSRQEMLGKLKASGMTDEQANQVLLQISRSVSGTVDRRFFGLGDERALDISRSMNQSLMDNSKSWADTFGYGSKSYEAIKDLMSNNQAGLMIEAGRYDPNVERSLQRNISDAGKLDAARGRDRYELGLRGGGVEDWNEAAGRLGIGSLSKMNQHDRMQLDLLLSTDTETATARALAAALQEGIIDKDEVAKWYGASEQRRRAFDQARQDVSNLPKEDRRLLAGMARKGSGADTRPGQGWSGGWSGRLLSSLMGKEVSPDSTSLGDTLQRNIEALKTESGAVVYDNARGTLAAKLSGMEGLGDVTDPKEFAARVRTMGGLKGSTRQQVLERLGATSVTALDAYSKSGSEESLMKLIESLAGGDYIASKEGNVAQSQATADTRKELADNDLMLQKIQRDNLDKWAKNLDREEKLLDRADFNSLAGDLMRVTPTP